MSQRRADDRLSGCVFWCCLVALPFVAVKEHRTLDAWAFTQGEVVRCWSEPDYERDRSDFFCTLRFAGDDPVPKATVNPLLGDMKLFGLNPFYDPYETGDPMAVFYRRGDPHDMDVDTYPTRYPFTFVIGLVTLSYAIGRVIRR